MTKSKKVELTPNLKIHGQIGSLRALGKHKIKHFDNPVNGYFGFYHFPLLDISKVEMFEIAKQHDFFDLLNLSWFCHYPIMKKKFGEEPDITPCGCCEVCNMSEKEGMGWRIPFRRRLKNKIQDKYRSFVRRLLFFWKKK